MKWICNEGVYIMWSNMAVYTPFAMGLQIPTSSHTKMKITQWQKNAFHLWFNKTKTTQKIKQNKTNFMSFCKKEVCKNGLFHSIIIIILRNIKWTRLCETGQCPRQPKWRPWHWNRSRSMTRVTNINDKMFLKHHASIRVIGVIG